MEGISKKAMWAVAACFAILLIILIPMLVAANSGSSSDKDVKLVSDLNTILAEDEKTNGKAETLSDAISVVSSTYTVSDLTSATSGDIVWDETSNRFVLVNSTGDVIYRDSDTSKSVSKSTLWLVANSVSDMVGGYNYYLNFATTSISAREGIDVGENEDVDVFYASNSTCTVTFVTNGGTLTIDNENAVVNHYGSSDEVVIYSVADSSFHEFGEDTGNVSIAKGHVVLESTSNVGGIYITATEKGLVTIANETESTVTVGATTEDIAQDAVPTESASKFETVASDEKTVSLFAGGFGTESSPYVIATTDQWLNLAASELATSGLNFKVIADLDFSDIQEYQVFDFNGVMDFNNSTITMGQDYLFYNIGMTGSTGTTLKNLNLVENGSYGLTLFLYLDTGNVTFSNISISGEYYQTDNNSTAFTWGAYVRTEYDSEQQKYTYNKNTLTFENCTNYANITATGSTSAGIFLGKVKEYDSENDVVYGSCYLVFDNCVNYGNLSHANGYASMLISNAATFCNEKLSDISVSDCVNYGTIVGGTAGTENATANLLCGGGYTLSASNSDKKFGETVTTDSIAEYITSTINKDGEENNLVNGTEDEVTGTCKLVETNSISVKEDGTYDLTCVTSDATSYDIIYTFWVTDIENGSGTTYWGSFSIIISLTAEEFTNLSLANYTWISETDCTEEGAYADPVTIGNKTIKVYTIEGTSYYVFESSIVEQVENITSMTISSKAVSMAIYAYKDGVVKCFGTTTMSAYKAA